MPVNLINVSKRSTPKWLWLCGHARFLIAIN